MMGGKLGGFAEEAAALLILSDFFLANFMAHGQNVTAKLRSACRLFLCVGVHGPSLLT